MPNKLNCKLLSIFISLCLIFNLFPLLSVSAEEMADMPIKQKWTDEEIIKLGYIPDEVVIKFKEDKVDLKNSAGRERAQKFGEKLGAGFADKVVKRMKKDAKKAERLNKFSTAKLEKLNDKFLKQKDKSEKRNEVLYEVGIDDGVMETIEELQSDPDVEAVIPNYVAAFNAIEDYKEGLNGYNQWNLNTINIDGAWDIATEKGEGVVVAVIDSGIAYNHPDLAVNMWTPETCKDSEGYIITGGCPNHGWNFITTDPEKTNDPNDYNGHGTHVAGIIGAMQNQMGVVGVSPNVKLMALKVGDAYGSYFGISKAIDFARENGADIINGSFGSIWKHDYLTPYATDYYFDEINTFLKNGGLYVASAGNDINNDNDVNLYLPGNYLPKTSAESDDVFYDNIISVAATDQNDELASFSNYGKETVDIAAPGTYISANDPDKKIMSTYIEKLGDILENFSLIDGIPSWGIFEKFSGGELNYWNPNLLSILSGDGALFTDPEGDTYSNNANTSVRTKVGAIDLPALKAGNQDASFGLVFDAWCDTEPMKKDAQGNLEAKDYIEVLLFDENEEDYEIGMFDENGDFQEGSNHIYEERLGIEMDEEEWNNYHGNSTTIGLNIPESLLDISNSVFQFRWVTDESNDDGVDHRGCYIDNVRVTYLEEEDETGAPNWYESLEGTSLSAPHVAGVAALLKAYSNQHGLNLTAADIKHIIMQSGDDVPALDGKTVSGKRLNSANALLLAGSYEAPDMRVFTDAPVIVNEDLDAYADSNEVLDGGDTLFYDLSVDNRLTFRILNSSRQSMTLNAALTGADADQFSISKNPASSLATQHSSEMTVTFQPDSAGNKNASVDINYTNTEGSGTFSVDLIAEGSGVFTNPQEIEVKDGEGNAIESSGTLDFGYTVNGGSVTKNIVISNAGNEGSKNLTIKSLSVQTGDGSVPAFGFQGDPGENTSLAPGESISVPIYFSAQERNSYSATLYIVNDDEDEGVYVINLTGSVMTEGSVSVSPTIHSTTTGGMWNNIYTWEEERLPEPGDVVEINGWVTVANDVTVSGILVNPNGTITHYYSSPSLTFTVIGNVLNNGNIINGSTTWGSITMSVSGDAENNGEMTIVRVIGGDFYNNGTVNGVRVGGNVTNNGSLGVTLNGTSGVQLFQSSTAVTGAIVEGNVEIIGNMEVEQLGVLESGSLNINPGNVLKITERSNNNGMINGGNMLMSGAEYFMGTGVYNTDKISFQGYENLLRGDVTVNGDVEVLANSVLTRYYDDQVFTLTVNGNVVNNGIIQNFVSGSYRGYIHMDVSGDMENSGEVNASGVDLTGNFNNSGTAKLIYVAGDVVNSGTATGIYAKGNVTNSGTTLGVTLNGTSGVQLFQSSTPVLAATIEGNVEIIGNMEVGQLAVQESGTLNISPGNKVTVTERSNNNGIINGGNMLISRAEYFMGTGQYNTDKIMFEGWSTKLRSDVTVNGDVEVLANSVLTRYYDDQVFTLTVKGNVVNNGIIQNFVSGSLRGYMVVHITGNITNNGSITATARASWPEVAGAESYEFQRTDENLSWLDPVPVSTAYYGVNNLVNTSHMWRSRAVTGGTAGQWSAVHYINVEPVPEITVKAGGTEIVSGGNLDMGSLTEGHWKAVSLNVSNDGLTELEVTGMNITGSDAGEFVLIGAPDAVPAGGSKEVIAGLIGGSTGTKSAALEITSSDEDEGVYIVNLSAQVLEDTGEIISEPTAEQESAGNWSDPGVWAEGEIPQQEDIAGIITNIILDLPEVILQGLIIEEGGVLEPGSLIAYHPESSSLFASLAEIFTPSAMAEGEEVMVLRILDDFVNRGIVRDSVSASLHLYIGKNFQNTGSMENSEVFVFRDEVSGAAEYEFQFAEMTDNGSGVLTSQWQEAVRVAENFYSIKNLVNSSMIWHARAVFAGSAEGDPETYGQWTPVYSINAVYVPAPEAEMRDGSDAVLSTNESINFGQITFEQPTEKLFTIANTGTRDMSVSNLSMTGDPNFSLQIIDGSDFTLAPGEVKAFGLHFMAEEEEDPGMRNAVFTFNTSDSNEGLFTINMTGEVIPAVDPVPVLTEVTAIPSPTTDRTPDYTFNSSEAGTISYEGGCESNMVQAAAGDNTVTFSPLLPGTYDSCFITVTDSAGGVSEPLAVSAFSVDQPSTAEADWETIISDLTLWQSRHADDLPEFLRVKLLEDRIAKYHFFLEKGKVRVAALFGRKAVKMGYPDIEGMVSELRQAFEEEDVSEDVLKRILIKLVWIEWHFTGELD